MSTSKDDIIAELAAVRDAKLRALRTGQRVQITGGYAVDLVDYTTLCRRERELRSRLLRSGGAVSRLHPHYGSDAGNSAIPETR